MAIQGDLWMDGGTAYNLELPTLVEHCRSLGFTDSAIVLDVILVSPTLRVNEWSKPGKALTMFWRQHEIRSMKKKSDDLISFMRAEPGLKYRYLVKPDEKLIWEVNFVDFDPDRSKRLIETGREVASKVVGLGEGVMFEEFKREFEQV